MSEFDSLGDYRIRPTNIEVVDNRILGIVSNKDTRVVSQHNDNKSGKLIYGGGGFHGPISYDLGETPFQDEVHVEKNGTVQALWLAKEGLEYELSKEFTEQITAQMEHTYSSSSFEFHVPEDFPDIKGWQMGLEWKLIYVPKSPTITRALYPEIYEAQAPGEDKISVVSAQLSEVIRRDPLVIISPIVACDFLRDNLVTGDHFKMYGRFHLGEIIAADTGPYKSPGSQEFYFEDGNLMQSVVDDIL